MNATKTVRSFVRTRANQLHQQQHCMLFGFSLRINTAMCVRTEYTTAVLLCVTTVVIADCTM